MSSSKIGALIIFMATISLINGSVLPPVPAVVPALRYARIAPPSVLPFSAQVNTFSRNLHVFDAPYAAGVLPGPPAIVQRALLPAPITPVVPAPAVFPRVASFAGPAFPRVAPVGVSAAPSPVGVPALAPPPPLAVRTSFLPTYPNVFAPAAVGRSIHTLSPALTPPLLSPAPLLG